MTMNRVDFGNCNVELDNCRSTEFKFCNWDVNNSQFKALRSTIYMQNCNLIAQFKYCQLEIINCTFYRTFIIEASSPLSSEILALIFVILRLLELFSTARSSFSLLG